MEEYLSPITMWKDFDAESIPLLTNVLREREENGIIFREVYFNGIIAGDGQSRIYGVLAFKKGAEKLPSVLLLDDGGKPMDYALLTKYADAGFCIFCIDYSGGADGEKNRFTIYPQSMNYAKYANASKVLFTATDDAVKNCWQQWAAHAKRAITQLAAFSECDEDKIALVGRGTASETVWKLAATDKRLKAAALIFAKNWTGRRSIYSVDEMKKPDSERENSKWTALVSSYAYAHHIQLPFYISVATNERTGSFDTLYHCYSRLPLLHNQIISVTEHQDTEVGFLQKDNIHIFLRKALLENAEYPARPEITYSQKDGQLFFSLKDDSGLERESVKLFYCNDNRQAGYRNWQTLKLSKVSETEFTAKGGVFFVGKLFLAFATIKFKNDMSVSSRLIVKAPQSMGITAPNQKQTRLVYDDSMGKDCFFVVGSPFRIFDAEPLELVEGPFQITGVGANFGSIATFKMGDACFCGTGESELLISLYVPKTADVTFIITVLLENGDEVDYFCSQTIDGQEKWQKIELVQNSFKTENGQTIEEWCDMRLFTVRSSERVYISSMLWA